MASMLSSLMGTEAAPAAQSWEAPGATPDSCFQYTLMHQAPTARLFALISRWQCSAVQSSGTIFG